MPAREINLIANKQTATPQEVEVRRIIGFWTPAILIVYLVILFSTLGLTYYSTNRLHSTEVDITSEKNRIASLINDEGLYILLKQKATTLGRIFSQRYPFSDVLVYLLGYKTDGITFQKIELSDDGNITLDVITQDSVVLDTFVRKLIEAAPTEFHQIDLVSLTYKTDGSYAIRLDMGKKTIKKTP